MQKKVPEIPIQQVEWDIREIDLGINYEESFKMIRA